MFVQYMCVFFILNGWSVRVRVQLHEIKKKIHINYTCFLCTVQFHIILSSNSSKFNQNLLFLK